MSNELHPNHKESQFLNLAYSKFYDLYDEIMEDSFWHKDDYYRYNKTKTIFQIYSELLYYEPFRYVLKLMETTRPPYESKIASGLFKCIRNILSHFPFFEAWNDVYFNKDLINWFKNGMTVDKFLTLNENVGEVKYRLWDSKKKAMSYMTISFPKDYSMNKTIYLKEIVTEKEGIIFSIVLMKNVLDTQVEK